MGLFDRLFGRKKEEQNLKQVEEVLENTEHLAAEALDTNIADEQERDEQLQAPANEEQAEIEQEETELSAESSAAEPTEPAPVAEPSVDERTELEPLEEEELSDSTVVSAPAEPSDVEQEEVESSEEQPDSEPTEPVTVSEPLEAETTELEIVEEQSESESSEVQVVEESLVVESEAVSGQEIPVSADQSALAEDAELVEGDLSATGGAEEDSLTGERETSSQPSAMEAYYADLQRRIAVAAATQPEEEPEQEEEHREETASPEPVESLQAKYDRSLKKTRTGFGAKLNAFFANFRRVDEDFFEELEELLITSDVGVQLASNLTEELRYEARLENAKKPEVLRQVILEKLVELYEKDGTYQERIELRDGLTVMLFVGVNGVGKTTSIGKLAYKYKEEGKKVMLVAADTFRAGAVAQLVEWGKRVGVPVVTGPEKADPASVVYDGMEQAVAAGMDILLIDTAGRLQNKDNLMAELEKIGRIIKRVDSTAPHETFLALDASTGQNALVQAKEFSKITPLTGIVLTKIDGTARGGVVLAIREELDIPVKLIGFGEKIDDLGEFNSENFMKGLLEGLI